MEVNHGEIPVLTSLTCEYEHISKEEEEGVPQEEDASSQEEETGLGRIENIRLLVQRKYQPQSGSSRPCSASPSCRPPRRGI